MIFWSKQGSVDFFAVADNFNGLFIVLGFVFPELTKKICDDDDTWCTYTSLSSRKKLVLQLIAMHTNTNL